MVQRVNIGNDLSIRKDFFSRGPGGGVPITRITCWKAH